MMLSSTLTKALKLSLAVMIAAPLVMATGALAQRTKRSASLSKAYKKVYRNVPWQKTLDRYYRPIDPQSDIKKARRTLLRDPGELLGLPSHGIRRPTAPNAPVVAPVTLNPVVSHLDADGDGSISLSEYFQGRSRLSNIGTKTNRNNRRRTQRLGSQFRQTDSNGDGKVTPEELQSRGSGRF